MSAEPEAGDKLEARSHRIIQILLRYGLLAAAALMLAGVIVKVSSGDDFDPAVSFSGMFSSGIDLADRLMAIGVLVLALTPAARVAALLVLWTLQRDRRFAITAGVVLCVLVLSVVIGYAR